MTPRPDLNKLAKEVFEANKAKGFHDEERSNETLLMLVITELSEAVEADRKGKRADMESYMEIMFGYTPSDSPLSFSNAFNIYIKDSIEDELADAVIRLLDLAGKEGFYLDQSIHSISELSFSTKLFIERSFAHIIYAVCGNFYLENLSIEGQTALTILDIEKICNFFNIDLWLHVELKLKYNATRPHKHGKKY